MPLFMATDKIEIQGQPLKPDTKNKKVVLPYQKLKSMKKHKKDQVDSPKTSYNQE